MQTPVDTEVILVSNANSYSAGAIDIPLENRWEPRPGHYLAMTIRRVDFTNFFRYNITEGDCHIQLIVEYDNVDANDFSWTAVLRIEFPVSKKTNAEILEYINTEIEELYAEIEKAGSVAGNSISACWRANHTHIGAAGAQNSMSRIAVNATRVGAISAITSLNLQQPRLELQENGVVFNLVLNEVADASAITLTAGGAYYPAMYVRRVQFQLEGGLPEKLGLLDPALSDRQNAYVFEIPENITSTTYYDVWDVGIFDYTNATLSNPPADARFEFPNLIRMNPHLLMIESTMIKPPRYPLKGFRSDIPRRAPMRTIPFPDQELAGDVQLFHPDPITIFRLPGGLDKLEFRFYFDGKPITYDGFDINLELVVFELPESVSLHKPTFDTHTHALVAPPILDFQGIKQSRTTTFTHPEEYDSRITQKRSRR